MTRKPVILSFNGEAKAPAASLDDQLRRSASNSGSVGNLYPEGQGLLVPLTPCHKLSFCGLRQSYGDVPFVIKLPCPGVSEPLRVAVSPLALSSCPSVNLPHWYKQP